ncbi:YbhB/YbcL family Raf kinase inhibitor-like protein [Caenimonas sedimenti]|uniref:YbhB/YbcL family Raf kinase inhibitor-like protein n=1 Tax=Caenimonas sedimenti TaxID=2596921 RepID=A0A562ZK13_9BURK|nr:YbhB/YbcL family Raf kinase inhibitor-like protein [Caenimonas sedimenti]
MAAALVTGCAATGNVAPPAGPVFTLWSPAFADGAQLEQKHAGNVPTNPNCVGQNVAPPLAWTNVPAGTRSFAMLVYDQQGRNGLGVAHWVAYNIPATVTAFADNEISGPSPKYTGGKSTLNLPNYMGPCPPVNTGKHHYVFTVIATDVEPGALPAGLTMQELTERLAGRAKGSSSMVLRYGRP